MKNALQTVAAAAAVLGLGWALAFHQVIFESVFGPKITEVRRKTFQESDSMVRGTNKELAQLKVQYLKEKDPATREALAALILETAKNIQKGSIEPEMRPFLDSLSTFQ